MKKAAILCALVMMISVVPAFALTQTNNTTDQAQNQTQTTTAQKTCDQTKCKATGDCNCDGDQHQYGQKNHARDGNGEKHQYGQNNNNAGNCDGDQHQYQYGQKNRNNQS